MANELLLKLGLQVSPRTVRNYLPPRPPGQPKGDTRWSTLLRLHAQEIIACDFLVVVTATFRLLYVFVVIEHRTRRLVHCNVTAHPTSAWTLQQQAGQDSERRLPVLSTYLGHSHISDTYWYLSAHAQLMGLAKRRLEKRWENWP
jgi:hypothetical protein